MLKRKFMSLFLLVFLVTLAGCGVKDTPTPPNVTGEEVTSLPDEETPELVSFAEVSEIDEPEYLSSDGLDESFTELKTWKVRDEQANAGYISIGTLKDDVDAGTLAVQLITAMYNDPEISEMDIPLNSASCGGYFIIVGAQNSASVVDKFSNVISTTPVSTIDDIFAAMDLQSA